MKVDVLLGLQWGDEGKGKIVDVLAKQYDIVARFQGGPNAGHTLVINGKTTVLHTIPSGVFNPNTINLIGNGVVIDPVTLKKEIETLLEQGINIEKTLFIAKKAHLILPSHKLIDAESEKAKGKLKIGSTLRGIGPAYMDKTGRNGLRFGDIFLEDFEERYKQLQDKHQRILDQYDYSDDISQYDADWMKAVEYLRKFTTVDCEYFVNESLKSGKTILAEGAQGSLLDIDFGTYPFVTSSNTITAGVLTGLGLAPHRIGKVIGITKAYCTRVGSGPFPTEDHGATGEKLRQEGGEFGATTGRPRRCGWIDLPALKYTIMLNGVTDLVVTKIDILNAFEEIQACDSYTTPEGKTNKLPYELQTIAKADFKSFKGWNCDIDACRERNELPEALKVYLDYLEAELEVPIKFLSTGPGRDEMLVFEKADSMA